MTKITFYKKSGQFIGFKVEGHTGKADYGSDLLCAQLSTVAQLAVVGIRDVGKFKVLKDKISDGFFELMVENRDVNSEKVQFLLETCYQSFKSIIIDEDKFAKLEVKNV